MEQEPMAAAKFPLFRAKLATPSMADWPSAQFTMPVGQRPDIAAPASQAAKLGGCKPHEQLLAPRSRRKIAKGNCCRWREPGRCSPRLGLRRAGRRKPSQRL